MLGSAGLHFTHRWQVRQQSGAYLRQADAARDANRTDSELDYLQRYLNSRPDAIDERERVARILARTAKTPTQLKECFIVLEDVLRRDPSRDDLRRFVVEYAMTRVGYASEAKGHLDILMAKFPDDGALENQYAGCVLFERDFRGAAEWYGKARAHRPDILNGHVGHALMLREHFSDPEGADRIMAEMVDGGGPGRVNASNFRAYLIRADYGRKYGQFDSADHALQKARELGPDELEVILFTAEYKYGKIRRLRRTRTTVEVRKANFARFPAQLAEIRAELDRGRKLHPISPAVYLSRAFLETEEGNLPAALGILEAGRSAIPDDVGIRVRLVDKQIESLDRAGAEASLAQLETLEYPIHRIAYERARVLMLQGAWLEAARALDIVRVNALDDAELARSANLMLGRCYEQIGETDRRLEAFTKSIPEDTYDPLWIAGSLGQAQAYTALGRPEDALRTYQKLADAAPGFWVKVAKFRMLMALRRPEAERDWTPVTIALERAVTLVPELEDDTEVQLLRADLHSVEKRDAESRKIVDDLFAKRPKEPAVWVAKAERTYRDGNPAEAVAILERGRAEQGDPAELRMAQALYVTDPKETTAEAKLTKLAEGIEKYTPSVRRHLLRSLAEAASMTGNNALAGSYWDRIVTVQPDDLAAQLVRFDRAIVANDELGLERVQAEIRRVDGDGGVSTQVCRALYLIWKAQKSNDTTGLPEAYSQLEAVERSRPGWSRIALGKAVILDRQGRADAALPFYQKAFDQGELNPAILRRLIELYAAKGQFGRADEILGKVADLDAGGPETQRLAADVSMSVGKSVRALKLAAKAVPADSKNPADWLWLGQLYWQTGDKGGAGRAIQHAVDLDPKSQVAWLTLIDFTVKTDASAPRDYKQAKARIELAKSAVVESQRSLFLAQCYALVREKILATEFFHKARAEQPSDIRTLSAEANFLMETAANEADWIEATAAWKRLIPLCAANPGEKEIAERMYTICMAGDTDNARAKQALEWLGMDSTGSLKTPTGNETFTQRRTRALALALQRQRDNKLVAIKLLEGDRAELTPADQFLLAKLYLQVGDRKNVRATMSDLALNADKSPLYQAFLAFYTAWLIQERDFADAATWLAKLAKLDPESLRTAELQAYVFSGKNDLAAAKNLLQKQAEKPNAPIGLIAWIAEKTGLPAEAERWLRQYIRENETNRPEAVLALAEFYARANRLNDAMAVCEKAWATCPPQVVAQVSVTILSSAKESPSKELIAKVTKQIETACETKGLLKAAVQPQLAFLRNLTLDYDESIAIFRTQADRPAKSLAEREARALAMNNLAYLLAAHKHSHDEALGYIKSARLLVGDYPELLDTEALVLMDRGAKEDLKAARPLLQGLVASKPTGVAYFHLALLEKKEGNREECQLAWRESKRLQLKASDLHPIERPALDAMEKELK